ncbi:alpha/beta hydrolase-fold protein [Fulvivirgaceae bacterium BMA12]|uniref:Alpha/beta hydrolase-fold protein n=1 Tax=Agaribacillus aureus TaxID=3051825 RepID=A0ABT8L6E5_9BACT|nr:alpha/beta hydrolase-fold protein [Fulvivirgaceae bacterium BMA12]
MFRTTEISNPDFESNNLRFITIKTPHLKGRGDICVFVPPDTGSAPIPLLILLHGVYGSAWAWTLKGGAHVSAMEMIQNGEIKPMAIAMPSDGLWGDGSAYLPHNGYDFEKWIVDDVPQAVIENIPAVTSTSKLFIGGLSMGGFGALRMGVKHAEKFQAISAHSSITDIEQMPLFVEEDLSHYYQAKPEETSVLSVIKEHRHHLPAIRFDCGTEDLLIEKNRTLHRQLADENIKHEYYEFEGGHEWPYWQKHIRDSLLFFNGQF